MTTHPLATASLLLALTTAPALAATITVSTALDVAAINAGQNGFTGGVQGTPPFDAPFSVTLAAGDTFDFSIDFLGAQTLTIVNPTSLWAFSYADLATEVTGTGTLSLLDSVGGVLWTSNVKTDTEGDAHFGQYFDASDFAGLPGTVTFGGLRYVGTVNAYVDPTVTVRTYDTPAFYFNADSFSVSAVPEPGTWSLTALGVLAIGLSKRRRRARAE